MRTVPTTRPADARVRLGAIYRTPLGRYCELMPSGREAPKDGPSLLNFRYVGVDGQRFGDGFALTVQNVVILNEVVRHAAAV